MAALTELKARSLRPEDKPIAHGNVTGLALHPGSTKGHGKWVLRYVSPVSGKRRNAGLGSYPAVTIADAARRALQMREQIAQGDDPLEVKEEIPAPSVPTFEEAAVILHGTLLPGWKNAKHAAQWIYTLREFAFPVLGAIPLNAIQPKDIAQVLRPIWIDKAETASRLKQRMHAVMAWGWAHGHCQANPVDVVQHLLPAQQDKAVRVQHQPAMPWRMIPAFVGEHLRNRPRFDVSRAILEFLILTACRSGEARGMVWEEIDWTQRIWTIPAERMKAHMPHRVPLTDRALDILRNLQGLHDTLVFPSPRDEVVLSDMAMTTFLRRTQAPSDTPGRWATAHGFRSSFRDWCSEQGYPRDLAERALAHTVQNKVEAAYHRTDLLEQRRPMMEAWAAFVESAAPQPAAKTEKPASMVDLLREKATVARAGMVRSGQSRP
ncbi:MAG: tyrosine-type recombinase/integrase [Thiomonas arsenitoxydans]|uniref:Tyrosine-type recombinase/integrase n=1 Tax=Thiomonas arsenitoxydans (strain DSM 22701 / CIP 110005 / 3As) TaxID=426114 RepID=A0A8I1SUT8_THIA3|nr:MULTISPECIES: site-specific integrase [Thiomonas]MBN8744965.1 tyrosine-type recombinase/integrase [Thiomonas arsenitoxydans]